MAELTHLFSPITIGTMTLKNRIVLLPTALGYTEGGRPGPRLTAYLEERARGGAGSSIRAAASRTCGKSMPGMGGTAAWEPVAMRI